MELKGATGAFLDAVGEELKQVLRAGGLRQAEVSWHPLEPGASFQDMQWWSAKFRDGANWIYAGAEPETWLQLASDSKADKKAKGKDNFSVLGGCLEKILSRELGPGKVVNDEVGSVDALPEGTGVTFEIQRAGSLHSLYCVLNPGLESALESRPPATRTAVSGSPLDLLMHVEVPVSVSFGSTRVRMRELLGLTPGSVVELDQSLGAQVDVRVNGALIARGEVVAVDGNYAVRVLEIVTPALNGSTK